MTPNETINSLPARVRDRLRDRRQRRYTDYDAFLSYSREDREFATRLQRALERFSKPWNRVRALKVYRDVSSLSPESGLWKSLEHGLEKSTWFILLASPSAARSRWVDREVAWWLEHRSIDSILVVLTEGQAVWDEQAGDFDWERCNWAPPSLRGRFADEPALIEAAATHDTGDDELGVEEATGSLVSAIKGIPKDEAFADAVREHRRTMRLARTGVISLFVLLLLAVTAGTIAVSQRDTARSNAKLAASRQLAAVSTALLRTNLDAALLLGVESVRRDSNSQTRSALLSATLASPHLVRYFGLPATVTAIAGSANGRVIVAGLSDGRIMRWDRTGSPRHITRLPNGIAQIAVDATGTTIAATDGETLAEDATAVLIRSGQLPRRLRVPEGQSPNAVGVSASGRTVLVAGEAAASGGAATVVVVNGLTGAEEMRHEATNETFGVYLSLPSDEEAVLFDRAYGGWRRHEIETWKTVDRGSVSLGAHEASGTPSADGRYMTATNGAPNIPVWRTQGSPQNDKPNLTANAPISNPNDLALSPDGTRLAVTDTGVIYVANTARPGEERSAPVVLEGNGSVDSIRFFGSASRLLTVSRNKVALWDLDQADRLARRMKVPVGIGCSACSGARIAVSPDGARAAVVSGLSDSAAVVDLRTGRATRLPGGSLDFQYVSPLWDGELAVYPIVPPAGGSEAGAPGTMPSSVRSFRAGEGSTSVMATGLRQSAQAVVVDERGKIFVQRIDDGDTVRTFTPFPDLQIGDVTIQNAAIDPASRRVGILLDDRISIIDLSSGRIVQSIRNPRGTYLAFGGQRLFVQQEDGTLEVRSGPELSIERTLVGDPSYAWPPVPNPKGTIVARQRRNRDISLVDANTGSTLATVPPNADSVGAKVGVAFSPDGDHLITVTDETTYQAGAVLLTRDISQSALIRSACLSAGSQLTDAQWQRLIGTAPPEHRACP